MKKYNPSDIIRLRKAFPEFNIRVRDKEDREIILFSVKRSSKENLSPTLLENRTQELKNKIISLKYKKSNITIAVNRDIALRKRLYRRIRGIQHKEYFLGFTTTDLWPVYEFTSGIFFIHQGRNVKVMEEAPEFFFTIEQLIEMGFKI